LYQVIYCQGELAPLFVNRVIIYTYNYLSLGETNNIYRSFVSILCLENYFGVSIRGTRCCYCIYLSFILHECVKTRNRSEATVCWEFPAANKETTKQRNQTLWCSKRTSL